MDKEESLEAVSPPDKISLLWFPVAWTVDNDEAERSFARLLWILIPVQFFVVTQSPRGFAGDDVVPALALSLISIAVVFVLGCIVAWIAAKWHRSKESMTIRVRMWVVALMIGTGGGYLLLALSMLALKIANHFELGAGIDTDFAMGAFLLLFDLDFDLSNRWVLMVQFVSNFLYAAVALVLIGLVLRRLRGRESEDVGASEELGDTVEQQGSAVLLIALIVAALMTIVNRIAMM